MGCHTSQTRTEASFAVLLLPQELVSDCSGRAIQKGGTKLRAETVTWMQVSKKSKNTTPSPLQVFFFLSVCFEKFWLSQGRAWKENTLIDAGGRGVEVKNQNQLPFYHDQWYGGLTLRAASALRHKYISLR